MAGWGGGGAARLRHLVVQSSPFNTLSFANFLSVYYLLLMPILGILNIEMEECRLCSPAAETCFSFTRSVIGVKQCSKSAKVVRVKIKTRRREIAVGGVLIECKGTQ